MRTEAVFMVLVMVVVGSLGVVVGMGSGPASNTPKQNAAGSCQPVRPGTSRLTTFPNGTMVAQVDWPVFTMRTDSQAEVCVTYYGILNGPGGPGTIYYQPLLWGPDTTELLQTSELSIVASPNPAYFAPGQNTTVVYNLTASASGSGFYGLSLFQFCVPIPLAVGQDPNSITLNDFPGLFGTYSCPAQVMSAQITGFGGGSVVFLSCTLGPLPKAGPQLQLCE